MKQQNEDNAAKFFAAGEAYLREGKLSAAADSFRRAIAVKPDDPELHNKLGIAQSLAGLRADAGKSFDRAIKLDPACPDYYNNLGIVLKKAGLLPQAIEVFRWAVKLNPDYSEALNNLGSVLWQSGAFTEAEQCLRRAIALREGFGNAYNNLGLVLSDLYQMDEAEECLHRAVQLCPQKNRFKYNLGVLLKSRGNLPAAEVFLGQSVQAEPDFKEGKFALAGLYLLRQDYAAAWPLFDESNESQVPAWCLPCPCRSKEKLDRRRVLLYADQGLGDTLQFVRFAPMVARIASHTGLLVQQPLERLLAASFPMCQVHTGEPVAAGEYDFAFPLIGLPGYFRTDAASIPAVVPYAFPPLPVHRDWQERLAAPRPDGRLRVGLVWAGNPRHLNDRNRSLPLALLREWIEATCVDWFSLQIGERAGDLRELDLPVADYSASLTDLAETAGLVAQLDLVVSVDTAVAHLAGALGKPVWLLVPYAPDWRWQLDRDDSPWYPTMRLFRQAQPGDWQEVLARLGRELQIAAARKDISAPERTT